MVRVLIIEPIGIYRGEVTGGEVTGDRGEGLRLQLEL